MDTPAFFTRTIDWLRRSRRRRLAAAGVSSVAAVLVVLALYYVASGGDASAPEVVIRPSLKPEATAVRRSPTARVSPKPTAGPISKPDPQTLLQAGYALDQVLDVNLDGSEAGQIVVISHTVYGIASTGNRTASIVPGAEGCPSDPK